MQYVGVTMVRPRLKKLTNFYGHRNVHVTACAYTDTHTAHRFREPAACCMRESRRPGGESHRAGCFSGSSSEFLGVPRFLVTSSLGVRPRRGTPRNPRGTPRNQTLHIHQKAIRIRAGVVLGLQVGLVLPLHLGQLDEQAAQLGRGRYALGEKAIVALGVALTLQRVL